MASRVPPISSMENYEDWESIQLDDLDTFQINTKIKEEPVSYGYPSCVQTGVQNKIPETVPGLQSPIKTEPPAYFHTPTKNDNFIQSPLNLSPQKQTQFIPSPIKSEQSFSLTELDCILNSTNNSDASFYQEDFYGQKNGQMSDCDTSGDELGLESPVKNNISNAFDITSEIYRQAKIDIDITCQLLNIPSDPRLWSIQQVQDWMTYQLNQFSLPQRDITKFCVDGPVLCLFNEEDFRQLLPDGAMLFAQLDIWKMISKMCTSGPFQMIPKPNFNMSFPIQRFYQAPADMYIPRPVSPASSVASNESCVTSPRRARFSSGDSSCNDQSVPSSSHDESSSRQSIHLWQFLKDLLQQPQYYSNCIRWLDRRNGIFKIEDSGRVAKLWGKRKNRPAMNYDKLSRSIRQYYKKGIIKKTEHSKRLVYKFCHPYGN